MRRIVYSVATSLDGFIAEPGEEVDWIPGEPAIDSGAFTVPVPLGSGIPFLPLWQGRAHLRLEELETCPSAIVLHRSAAVRSPGPHGRGALSSGEPT